MGKIIRRQVVVIGLGQFGMALTRSLSERGADVIAIDTQPDKIQMAAAFASEALCFDATDEEALARINPAKRDVCVCATGDQSKEAAIIVTALLRQLGAPRIIARANDDLHKRILLLVGAHEVVNPEWAFGERFWGTRSWNSICGADTGLSSWQSVAVKRVPCRFLIPMRSWARTISWLWFQMRAPSRVCWLERDADNERSRPWKLIAISA